MTHKPIHIENLSVSFSQKVCIEDLTMQIAYGDRIALIGRNGSGKSTFLKILAGLFMVPRWMVSIPRGVQVGFVPQMPSCISSLSGGEHFNQKLRDELQQNPNMLLLDEPTNHLDRRGRRHLMRFLDAFPHTLLTATHDVDVLTRCFKTFMHFEDGEVHLFRGHYEHYQESILQKRESLQKDLHALNVQKKVFHKALMQEQERAKKSNLRGEKSIENRKWPTIVSSEKARRAIETSGRKKSAIRDGKQDLENQLRSLKRPAIIQPKFSITLSDLSHKHGLSIKDGAVRYKNQNLLEGIFLEVLPGDRVAILGENGSGKSTLLKAILGDLNVQCSGEWQRPSLDAIGYLDQNYQQLSPHKTVEEELKDAVIGWPYVRLRQHLNDFLFRKNEEVTTPVAALSEGERARLSLCLIAAKTPPILILDEMTNNLDLETRAHVIEVIRAYPGTLFVVSHDHDFLNKIKLEHVYVLRHGTCERGGL
ncbi:MAG: ATP-binding cassette domain-containing protein [Candidatus Nucleicultricaceae bacterium]